MWVHRTKVQIARARRRRLAGFLFGLSVVWVDVLAHWAIFGPSVGNTVWQVFDRAFEANGFRLLIATAIVSLLFFTGFDPFVVLGSPGLGKTREMLCMRCGNVDPYSKALRCSKCGGRCEDAAMWTWIEDPPAVLQAGEMTGAPDAGSSVKARDLHLPMGENAVPLDATDITPPETWVAKFGYPTAALYGMLFFAFWPSGPLWVVLVFGALLLVATIYLLPLKTVELRGDIFRIGNYFSVIEVPISTLIAVEVYAWEPPKVVCLQFSPVTEWGSKIRIMQSLDGFDDSIRILSRIIERNAARKESPAT